MRDRALSDLLLAADAGAPPLPAVRTSAERLARAWRRRRLRRALVALAAGTGLLLAAASAARGAAGEAPVPARAAAAVLRELDAEVRALRGRLAALGVADAERVRDSAERAAVAAADLRLRADLAGARADALDRFTRMEKPR